MSTPAKHTAGEWQTIESAPRDGTQVILYAEAWSMSWGEIQTGHFEGDGEGGGEWVTPEGAVPDNGPDALVELSDEDFDADDLEEYGPTHWMPLPNPPALATPVLEREGR